MRRKGNNAEDEKKSPPPQYETLDAFVEELIAVIYERPTRGSQSYTWCSQWWMHDEAVFRFSALHSAWEYMRVHEGPTAMAAWLVNYADPIMRVVLDKNDGPFKGCTVEDGGRHDLERTHTDGRLPCDPAPTGLFDERT